MDEWKATLVKYRHERCPEGHGVLYRFKRKTGSLKAYIGITGDFPERFRAHVNGRHDASRDESAIHNAIKKYGIDAFDVEILDYLPEEELPKEEVEAIAFQKTLAPLGYNLDEGGDRARPSKETLIKKSASMKRVIASKSPQEIAEWRAKNAAAQTDPKRRKQQSISKTNWWKTASKAQRDGCSEQHRKTVLAATKEKLDKMRARVLPFEPKASKRITGQLYIRWDGKIGRACAQGKLTLACPSQQTEAVEKKIDRFRRLARPYERDPAKRIVGELYVRYDGKIGRTNLLGKLPIVCAKQQM